jgi:Uma2 family endonuclease
MGFAVAALYRENDAPEEDHIVHLRGTFDDYEQVLAIRGDKSAPRIAYLEGVIEIMAPSRPHENIKSLVGRLLEAWCFHHGQRFTAVGAWTQQTKKDESAVEPDESYVFGEADESRRPDLAIEVVWTSGGINKLEIYRRLGIREVWFWRKGALQPYALRGDHYEAIEGSEVLPNIDLALLVSFLDRPTTYDAVQEYRRTLEA